MVDELKIEDAFNPRTAFTAEPDPSWNAMLDRYSQRSYRRTNIQKEAYTQDLQRMLDFFVNPEGVGCEAIEKTKKNLGKSIDAYNKLADFRKNPYQALIELSLLPISHWELYAQRKIGKS